MTGTPNRPDRATLAQTGVITSNIEGTARIGRVVCRVTSGSDQGRDVLVGSRPVVIGAHSTCDLVLNDSHLSRKHVEISLGPSGLSVRDLESTNGTFYQGSRITEALVPLGSAIKVGESVLTLSAVSAPHLPPSRRDRFGGLVGDSALMREIFAILELASPTNATVVLEGESGTGKDLVARAITRPLVRILLCPDTRRST
ncbi:FHA domain-containing protein [Myxococcota bacterium]